MLLGEFHRGRRLRRTPTLREMVRETELRPQDLIQGYFVVETADKDFERPIPSLPGQSQFSVDRLVARVGMAMDKGLRSLILFGLPEKKDPEGSGAYAADGIVQQAVARLKDAYPELVVVTDVCLCEYTSHGHCGLVDAHGEVQNDPTLDLLAQTAVSQARAGADIIAPSDMMDGRVAAIRLALDEAGFTHIPILSYAVKYASAFYGPFREAADSAPAFGDRRGYQMDPANVREALREAAGRSGRGRGHAHGQAGHALSRRGAAGAGQFRLSGGRLPGERRVCHAQGCHRQRLARPQAVRAGSPDRHQTGRRGLHHHLLRGRGTGMALSARHQDLRACSR